MNATDINEVSIKTRYPDLSFETDGIILEGLVQKIDMYDNSCSFGNCSFQSIYEVVHDSLIASCEAAPYYLCFLIAKHKAE